MKIRNLLLAALCVFTMLYVLVAVACELYGSLWLSTQPRPWWYFW